MGQGASSVMLGQRSSQNHHCLPKTNVRSYHAGSSPCGSPPCSAEPVLAVTAACSKRVHWLIIRVRFFCSYSRTPCLLAARSYSRCHLRVPSYCRSHLRVQTDCLAFGLCSDCLNARLRPDIATRARTLLHYFKTPYSSVEWPICGNCHPS